LDEKKPIKAYNYFIDTIKLYCVTAEPPDVTSILHLPYPLYVDIIKEYAEQKRKELEKLKTRDRLVRTRRNNKYVD